MMRAQYGFTLIETMVAVAILAIVVAIAAPSFSRTLESNRAAVTSNELLGALQSARAEALMRRSNVTLCRRDLAGTACEGGTDWTVGWVMMQGNVALRVWEPVRGVTLAGLSNGVTYASNGMTTLNETQSFSIQTSSCRRTLSVNLTGNAFVNQSGC